jgi:hypothetical protein
VKRRLAVDDNLVAAFKNEVEDVAVSLGFNV